MARSFRACCTGPGTGGDPSLRILIVDADAYFRRDLREALHEAGMRVVGEAADGHRALQLTDRSTSTSSCSILNCPAPAAPQSPRGCSTPTASWPSCFWRSRWTIETSSKRSRLGRLGI
jgi:hypothetical protein